MYIFFVLAMVVAAFGGPLTGSGQQANRAAEMMDTARTRILADAVLEHHKASLTYAENNTSSAVDVTTSILTASADSAGLSNAPWEIYGESSSSSITAHGDIVQANFASHADPTSNAVITFSKESGAFTGPYDSSYDRAGVLKQIARTASAGTFVGVIEEVSSAGDFRNADSIRGFEGIDTTFTSDSAYSNLVAVSPLGREARALPFTRSEFAPGVIVVITQFGTGDKEIRNPFGGGAS